MIYHSVSITLINTRRKPTETRLFVKIALTSLNWLSTHSCCLESPTNQQPLATFRNALVTNYQPLDQHLEALSNPRPDLRFFTMVHVQR